MFGLAGRWKRSKPDRLDQLARAVEAIGADDQRLLDQSVRVERLRERGAGELFDICRRFVGALNDRLSQPALILDPEVFSEDHYTGGGPCLFQINLRGRLLQIEFHPTEELDSNEDFGRRYVLYGTVRSFNRDYLARDTIDEKSIFYCPEGEIGHWHYLDSRTYASGIFTQDFLIAEMARLL